MRFSKAALTTLMVSSLILSALAQNFGEATWTLDETPTKRAVQVRPKPLLDIPEPLRHLFPVLGEIERNVSVGLNNGDVGLLLSAVENLRDAQFFTGSQGAGASSDQLLKEAGEIAWQQRDPERLRETLALWTAPNRTGQNQEMIDLTKDRLEQVEREREEMLQKKRCRVIFHNKTERSLQVFVNKKPIGTLAAGEKQEVDELLAGRQYLGALDETLQWGPRQVYVGPGEVFNWRLFD